MVKLVNRARMTTPSTGTGTLTLGVALNGFQSFAAAGVGNSDVVRYLLEEGEAWELGIGTYSASGTTLTRSVTESSDSGNLISLTGTAIVSLVLTAADLDGKVAATDLRLTDAREWSASTVAQAEAEAGTATTRRAFTAQRIRQAILAWWAGSADKTKLDGIASGAEVNSVVSVAGKTGAVSLTAADVGAADVSHSHGSLTSDGRIGSTANLVVVTGTSGALTAKAAGTTSQYLRGDGNWATPPNTTYAEISTSEIDAGTASTLRTITGRRMGYALGKKADLAHGHAAASTVADGFMAASDKAKLDGIATGAQVNTVTSVAGKTGAVTLSAADVGAATASHSHAVASTTSAGFLSAADKSKLDGIAAGAQVNAVTSVAGKTGTVTLGVADVAGAFPASALPAGTRMLFAQSSAPLGWTKDVSHNNKALRVVSGTAGSGGSVGFTTAFAERAVNGTIGSTAAGGTVQPHSLSWHEMPAHSHEHVHLQSMTGFGVSPNNYVFGRWIQTNADSRALPAHFTGQSGSSWGHSHGFTGQSHSHDFTGTAIDLAVAYVDIIIATKD
ncbi:hypothetical protein ABWH93_16925 [Seohaeicola saemankumensis]|uniref:hypothetical protein n=1 Tax=Seohaeicola TaxID=481178 RepID=UPI0035D07FBD